MYKNKNCSLQIFFCWNHNNVLLPFVLSLKVTEIKENLFLEDQLVRYNFSFCVTINLSKQLLWQVDCGASARFNELETHDYQMSSARGGRVLTCGLKFSFSVMTAVGTCRSLGGEWEWTGKITRFACCGEKRPFGALLTQHWVVCYANGHD